MEYFYLYCLDEGGFDLEAIERWIESFPYAVKFQRSRDPRTRSQYVLCVSEEHKAHVEKRAQAGEFDTAYNGCIALRDDHIFVDVYTTREPLKELSKAIVPIMKQYHCRVIDDRNQEYTERYKDDPEQLFRDLISGGWNNIQ